MTSIYTVIIVYSYFDDIGNFSLYFKFNYDDIGCNKSSDGDLNPFLSNVVIHTGIDFFDGTSSPGNYFI